MHAVVAKIQPDKFVRLCADGEFLSNYLRPVFSASRVQHISNLRSKFALRPHHVWKYGNLRPLRLVEEKNKDLQCGPMPNVMAAQPNIGGAFCESSVIPFRVPRSKVWLTPTAVRAVQWHWLSENARLGRKVNFAPGKIPSGGKSPRKCTHIVYQPKTRSNIVQSLVCLRWATSVQ